MKLEVGWTGAITHMADNEALRDPWLVAAWPGMGNVAVGAAGHLVVKLGARLTHEVHARDLFDVPHIEVRAGVAKPGRLPRNMFFQWRNPSGPHDLLIFIGEAQPVVGGYSLCHKLLDYAQQRGASRLFTFAAMASQLHPGSEPRVFGVATEADLLPQLQALEVDVLREGQISGLNGVLLSAGAERNISGACLLGELPYFAAAVPNPKASLAVLEIFLTMAGIELDLSELKQQAEAVQRGLVQLLERMQEAARQAGESGEEGFTIPEFAQPDEDQADQADEPSPNGGSKSADTEQKKPVDPAARRKIDALFKAASQDRSKAFRLKQELDRLGLFDQYENQFLDLFRKGE